MNVRPKHIATFLLGAAAAVAALKYATLSDDDKEKLVDSLKEKANNLKDDAETKVDKVKELLTDLSSKGSETLKDSIADVEGFIKDIMKKGKSAVEDVEDDIADKVKA